MKLNSIKKGKYKIVTITESLKLITDLSELKTAIEQFLASGDKYIAVNFADATYLYSGAISVLITCYKLIKNSGGNLCIIEPQKRIRDLLIQMNIDSLIDIFDTEQDLLRTEEQVIN